ARKTHAPRPPRRRRGPHGGDDPGGPLRPRPVFVGRLACRRLGEITQGVRGVCKPDALLHAATVTTPLHKPFRAPLPREYGSSVMSRMCRAPRPRFALLALGTLAPLCAHEEWNHLHILY